MRSLPHKIKSVSGEQETLQLEVLNRDKDPEIMLEQIVYNGDKQEVRVRIQMKQTLNLILHEVDEGKTQVNTQVALQSTG